MGSRVEVERGRVVALLTVLVVAGVIALGYVQGRGEGSAAPPTEVVSDAVTAAPEPTATHTSSPTGTATPVPTASSTPTVDPTEAQLEELRASNMWEGLAEWDRAVDGRQRFRWTSTETDCPYGPFSNAEEVWDAFAPALREEMLRLVITEGISVSPTRYPGTPFEDDFEAGLLGWWTNGEGGTQGRGTMFSTHAAYVTAAGEARIRYWAVLVGHGTDPTVSTEANLRAVGPPLDLSNSQTPATAEDLNDQFNDHHLAWLFDEDPINDPIDPPLPCA